MGITKIFIKQVRKPEGFFGKLIVKGMNRGSHAKLANWGINHIEISNNDIILDIGCGGGGNIKNLAKIATKGKVFGIDYSKTSIKIAKKVNRDLIEKGNIVIKHASVSKLPFEDDTFDLVTAFEAYYFWSDLINDLKEIYRVIKPNGMLILVNEAYKCQNEYLRKRNEKWAKLVNFKIYSPEEFKSFIKIAGYSEIEIYEEEDKSWITIKGKKNKS